MQIDSVTGRPGMTVVVPVRLASNEHPVAAVEHEILFDAMRFDLATSDVRGGCSLAAAPEGTTLRFEPVTLGRLRVRVANSAENLPDGILYTCSFRIRPSTPSGVYPLRLAELRAFGLDGTRLEAVRGFGGGISVLTSEGVLLTVGSSCGPPGGFTVVAVSISSTGVAAAGTENDLGWNTSVLEVRRAGQEPICRPNPLHGKPIAASVVAGGSGLRVEVIGDGFANTLADGLLYECSFRIADDARPGSYPINISRESAFDPFGEEILGVGGQDGSVEVGPCCVADCNRDGVTGIDDLVLAVNIALGAGRRTACPGLDVNLDDEVGVDELIRAVNEALAGGC